MNHPPMVDGAYERAIRRILHSKSQEEKRRWLRHEAEYNFLLKLLSREEIHLAGMSHHCAKTASRVLAALRPRIHFPPVVCDSVPVSAEAEEQ